MKKKLCGFQVGDTVRLISMKRTKKWINNIGHFSYTSDSIHGISRRTWESNMRKVFTVDAVRSRACVESLHFKEIELWWPSCGVIPVK